MRMKPMMIAAMVATGGLMTSACVTNPETCNRRLSRAAIGGVAGAVGGYLLGDLLGGRSDRTETILGAGIGAVAGAGVGAYMDRQERQMRERTAGTGIEVDRQGDQIVLNMPGDVTFDTDSALVKSEFRATLDQVAATLNEFPSSLIDVYGHTDSRGSDGYNQGLSERRATAVQSYLASRGVAQARMAARGYGESQLKCAESDAEGLRCNRRVEIRIAPVTTETTTTTETATRPDC